MIEIWMSSHLVSEYNCNNVNLQSLNFFYKEWQIIIGYDLVLVTLHWGLQLVSSKTIRIGDTKYDISVLEEGAKPIQPLIIIIIRKSYISPRLGESCNIVVFMFLLFARVSPTLILKVGLLGKLNFIHCIYIFF